MKKVQFIRREYGEFKLEENSLSPNPFVQFETWLNEALKENLIDPNAMVLATTDDQGMPDTRVVLLKEFSPDGFIFYTDYCSHKALQAEKTGKVALNFYWPPLARQIRIRGNIERISQQQSEVYFASRSRESQIAALTSKQSSIINSRDELENHYREISIQYQDKPIPCPENWGGYRVIPFEFEFFQGRNNRLNDRIFYRKVNDHWQIQRLSP